MLSTTERRPNNIGLYSLSPCNSSCAYLATKPSLAWHNMRLYATKYNSSQFIQHVHAKSRIFAINLYCMLIYDLGWLLPTTMFMWLYLCRCYQHQVMNKDSEEMKTIHPFPFCDIVVDWLFSFITHKSIKQISDDGAVVNVPPGQRGLFDFRNLKVDIRLIVMWCDVTWVALNWCPVFSENNCFIHRPDSTYWHKCSVM